VISLARAPLAPVTTTSTSTTLAPAPTAPSVTRPVDVPADPYALEPVRLYGRIEIPKLGLVHDLYEGVTLNNIDHGPAHWPGTATPGQAGNAVFAGHRVTHDHPFLNIDSLLPGDLVVFEVNGQRSTYRVTGHEIVTPKDTWIANQTSNATATIYACHPPHSAAYRYVVRMDLVPPA